MTRTALFACLLFIGSAYADTATCTFTWNSLTKSFVRSCTGNVPMLDLTMEEQIALKQGTAKACVITATHDGKKAQFRRECK